MTQNYLRYCSIIADGVGSIDLSTLRCRFHITQATMQAPNLMKLMVTNPLPQMAQQFVKKEFQEHHGRRRLPEQPRHRSFKGDIVFSIYGRESPTDTLLTVWASDGDEGHNYAMVNTTHPPGSTPQQHFNTALQAMQQYGLSQGYIGIDLSTPIYPRAVTLFGMARDVLANIAKTKNASVSYQNGQITMVPKGGSAPGGAIVLNSQTGLIGMPTQTLGSGIFARCLINPAIGIHSQVQINQGDIQGFRPQSPPPARNSSRFRRFQASLPMASTPSIGSKRTATPAGTIGISTCRCWRRTRPLG